jgi:hypothetical protein
MVKASSALLKHWLKALVQFFFDCMSFNCSSAFLGSSQKLGASVFSSSSSISRILRSMSKIPPQRFNALPEISQLFYSYHAAKVIKKFIFKSALLFV